MVLESGRALLAFKVGRSLCQLGGENPRRILPRAIVKCGVYADNWCEQREPGLFPGLSYDEPISPVAVLGHRRHQKQEKGSPVSPGHLAGY